MSIFSEKWPVWNPTRGFLVVHPGFHTCRVYNADNWFVSPRIYRASWRKTVSSKNRTTNPLCFFTMNIAHIKILVGHQPFSCSVPKRCTSSGFHRTTSNALSGAVVEVSCPIIMRRPHLISGSSWPCLIISNHSSSILIWAPLAMHRLYPSVAVNWLVGRNCIRLHCRHLASRNADDAPGACTLSYLCDMTVSSKRFLRLPPHVAKVSVPASAFATALPLPVCRCSWKERRGAGRNREKGKLGESMKDEERGEVWAFEEDG